MSKIKYINEALENVIRGCADAHLDDKEVGRIGKNLNSTKFAELCAENNIHPVPYGIINCEKDGINKKVARTFNFLYKKTYDEEDLGKVDDDLNKFRDWAEKKYGKTSQKMNAHYVKPSAVENVEDKSNIASVTSNMKRKYNASVPNDTVAKKQEVPASKTEDISELKYKVADRLRSLENAVVYAKDATKDSIDYEFSSRGLSMDDLRKVYKDMDGDSQKAIKMIEKTKNLYEKGDRKSIDDYAVSVLEDKKEAICVDHFKKLRKDYVDVPILPNVKVTYTQPSSRYAPRKFKKPSKIGSFMGKVKDFLCQPVFGSGYQVRYA